MLLLSVVGALVGCAGEPRATFTGGGQAADTGEAESDCGEVFSSVVIRDGVLTIDWSAMSPVPRTLIADVIGGDPEVVERQICDESLQATQIVAAWPTSPEESPATSMAVDLSGYGGMVLLVTAGGHEPETPAVMWSEFYVIGVGSGESGIWLE